jgi:phosphomannomutase
MIDYGIFKAYDVRGIYPTSLHKEAAFLVGQAFIKHSGAKKVAVGFDARLSGPELKESLIAGIISQGADVYDIGQTPTEGIYFAVANYDFDAGVMITASHNPKEYNGFKMLTKKPGDLVRVVRGIDLLSIAKENHFETKTPGAIFQKDIWNDYIEYVMKFAGTMKPFKVVVDASNGVIGSVFSKLKDKLPIEIIDLHFNPDGNFPNHSPNPLEPGASEKAQALIKAEGADFGFMFDGDADRIFLLDENGALVQGDITLLLLAKTLLKKYPGMGIAYNATCSRAVEEMVKQWQGVPVRTQVGFVNVREGLIQHNGIVGGETSCHYCFRDYFYMDSGIVAFLTLLNLITEDGRKVSEMVKELSLYVKTEMNFKVSDKEKALEMIKQNYADGKQDFLDGITVWYQDWWFNVRPSNTEPLLRLTIEADTQELLTAKKEELSKLIAE